MVSVLVTGSADGIGRETARQLATAGHRVTLHARNEARGRDALAAVPDAAGVVVGDLASLAETRALGTAAKAAGPYDVVIHNAGTGAAPARTVTEDGLEQIFQVNVLAPYLLTALLPRPQRLVYLTSDLQDSGVADLDDLQYERAPWHGMQAYSDSKLYDVMLAFAVARHWPDVYVNAVDPGWIRTRMGGPSAPRSPAEGADTQVWLATSEEPAALVTGRYFRQRREQPANPVAQDTTRQDRLLAACARLAGAALS